MHPYQICNWRPVDSTSGATRPVPSLDASTIPLAGLQPMRLVLPPEKMDSYSYDVFSLADASRLSVSNQTLVTHTLSSAAAAVILSSPA